MKYSEIKVLTVEELEQKIKGEQETLQKLKFSHAVSPIENPMRLRETKKLIARLKTALRVKELENA